jgi:ethanolamine utilization protein EutN
LSITGSWNAVPASAGDAAGGCDDAGTERHVLIGRVIGAVVATHKHAAFEGAKLLLVQPLDPDNTPRGPALLAVDGVGAGVDERVLIVLEGRAAGETLGRRGAPVDAAIIGIVDQVDLAPEEDAEGVEGVTGR